MRPLADGRVIQVRQILSLIEATELFARQCGIAAKLGHQPIKVPESSALQWLIVQEDENLRPGWYPKWINQPDGRLVIVSTREEHARLFTEDWLTRNIVTTLANTDGEPRASRDELSSKPAASVINGWESIEISFLSDERVQIRIGTNTETHNYGELGFADRRAKVGTPKPNQAWVTFRSMAEHNGIIRDGRETGVAWSKVEKRIQEIRKVLRKHFGITVDPIPFVEGTGFKARFKIACGPSFNT
jgi:hypothetical protein